MTTFDTAADAAALLLHKHKLQLSILVQRLHWSEEPERAWRFECVVHKLWRSDAPLIRANGFARTQAEAREKAESWRPREVTIAGLHVLISDGPDLLRAEAYVPALQLSTSEVHRGSAWSWKVPAADLAPMLASLLWGVSVDGMDAIEMRGKRGVPLGERPSVDEIVAGVIDDARAQIRKSIDAARSFAARMDADCANP